MCVGCHGTGCHGSSCRRGAGCRGQRARRTTGGGTVRRRQLQRWDWEWQREEQMRGTKQRLTGRCGERWWQGTGKRRTKRGTQKGTVESLRKEEIKQQQQERREQRAIAVWGVSMGVKQYTRAWVGVRSNAPPSAASFLTPGISLENSTSAQQAMYHAQAAIVARYEAAQQAATTAAAAPAVAAAAAAATPPAAAQPRRYGFCYLPPRAPQAGLQQQAAAT